VAIFAAPDGNGSRRFNSRAMLRPKTGGLAAKHRGVDFDVEEVSASKWRWIIHQNVEAIPQITSDPEYSNQVAGQIASINRINSELGAANDAQRPGQSLTTGREAPPS
jgi:hypothetical protein